MVLNGGLLLACTGLSRFTIYRKVTEDTVPPQLRISANGAGGKESDINRWVVDPVRWRPEEEVGDGKKCGRKKPANDNRPPNALDAGCETGAFERLDSVVLSIAWLIGRRMAREDYENVLRAANDNNRPEEESDTQEDHQGTHDD